MSKSIDNKVVSMEFDNSKFEKPAQESISTLDKLKEALHFKNVESGFDAMNHAIKKVTFDPLMKGVDTVYAKFTFFERFTIQLYDRLANKIIDTGKLIAKETFTTPISSGKSEYEEKMTSVQTIMASTGESLETVNKYLNELNKYSDDTIYSFRDMTTNIGKFTNAGVKLEDAVAAIKGVSNEAALSGANANEASRAMYNFAQALSTGSVKLIDWKSIENANMATIEFKKQLLETAESVGTLTSAGEGLYKTEKGHLTGATHDFNGQLKDEWLTSEVLIKTLKKYANVKEDVGKRATAAATEVKTFTMMMDTLKEALQSGWAESWEYIFGDFEKAKQLWTDLSKVLGGLLDRMSRTRNTMLKFWNEFGGRTAMLNAIKNAWKALTTVLGAVRDAFRTVFPPMTGRKLVELTERFERFTKSLKPSYVTIQRLRSTFTGLFSAVGIVIDAFRSLYNVLRPLVGKVFGFMSEQLLQGSASLGEWVTGLRESIKEGRVFERVFGKVGEALAWVGSKLKSAFLAVKEIVLAFKNGGIKEGFTAIKDAFMDLFHYIWEYLKKHNPIEWVKDLGVKIADAIYDWPVGKAIIDFLKKIRDAIANSTVWKFCVGVVNDFVDAIQWVINRFRGVDTSATKEFSENVSEGFHPLKAIKDFFVKIWHGILKVWEVIGPTLKSFGAAIKQGFVNLFEGIKGVVDRSDLADAGVFGAGAGLGAMLGSIASFILNLSKTVKNTAQTVKAIKKLVDSLKELFKAFKVKAYASAIKDTAIAIGILAASLFVIAALPQDAMWRSTAAILTLFRALASAMTTLNRLNSVGTGGKAGVILTFGVQMALMAAAIGVLVANMLILALIPYEYILKGLAVIVLMMRALTSEVSKLGSLTGTAKVSGLILAFAAFIQLLVVPLSLLSLLAYVNERGLWMGTAVILVFIAGLSVIAGSLSAAVKKWGSTSSVRIGGTFMAMMVTITGILFAIAALAGVIVLLKIFKVEDAIITAAKIIGNFVVVLAILAASLAALPIIISKFQYVGTWASFTGEGKMGGVGIFAPIIAAMLGISVAIIAISGAVALMGVAFSLLPKDVATKVANNMSILVITLGLLAVLIVSVSKKANDIKAAANVGNLKNNKVSVSLFPPIVSFIMAAALATVAIAAAAKMTANIKAKDIWTMVGVMAAILALVTVLGLISSNKNFGGRFAKGIDKASTAISKFAKMALIFTVAVTALVAGLIYLVGKSEDEFDNFVKMINSKRDVIIKTIQTVAEIALTAALGGLFTALKTLTKETIKGLGEVLDELIANGPEFVRKILTLIGIVLDGITEKADFVVEKLVTALLAIIRGLNNAIEKHGKEIVQAVDALMLSITKLWVMFFGKLGGLADEELDDFAAIWAEKLKPITSAIVEVITVSKLISSVANATTSSIDLISKVGRPAINFFKNFGKGAKLAFRYGRDFSDIWHEFKEAGGDTSSLSAATVAVAKFGGALKGLVAAHPALTIAAVVGTVIGKIWIDAATDAMDTITYMDEAVADAIKSVREEDARYQESLANRKAAFEEVDKEVESTEVLIKDLRECVDQNGKLKKGYEGRFDYIKEQLQNSNSPLQLEIDAQTEVVKLIDKQNNAYDVQSQKIDEIMKRTALRSKLEAVQGEAEEARKKLRMGDYQAEIGQAEQKMAELRNKRWNISGFKENATIDELVDAFDTWRELKALNLSNTDDRYAEYQALDLHIDEIADAAAAYYALDTNIAQAKRNMTRAQAVVDQYDKGFTALDGSISQVEQALTMLDNNLMLSESGESLNGLISQMETYRKKYQQIVDSGVQVSDETKKEFERIFDTLGNDISKFGDDGYKYLDEIGYSSGTNYVGRFIKGVSDAVEKANTVDKEKIEKSMKEAAENGIKGFTESVLSGEKPIDAAFKYIIGSAVSTTKEELDEHSPSRVFAKIGEFTIAGLIQGVTSKENSLEKTYSAMAAGNIAAYTAAMSAGGSSMVFTPMINQAGIQNGTAAIQGQLNSLTATPLGATLTSQLAARVDTSQIDADHSNVLSAMTGIRDEILNLSDRLANLEVVMDTGATVGALAPAMDMELGRRTVRKSRGV